MPEEATLDAPAETTSAPPQEPHSGPIPPELQALMERVLPIESDEPPPGDKPIKKEEPKPAPDKTTSKEPNKDEKTTLRLAPDMTAASAKEAQPDPAPEIEITDEMIAAEKSPKKQADLRKFRESYEALQRELTTLKSTPKQPAEDPGAQAIIERQTQQIAELSSRLERQNLREHPLFQQQYVQPREQMFSEALDVVKETGGDAEAFERAMALSGKARINALDEIVKDVDSTVMRTRLERLIDGIDTKDREIATALKDSKGLSEKLRRDEKIARHEMLQRQEQQLKSLLGAARRELGENLKLEVLQKSGQPDFKWWDDQVDEINATAEEILLKATPDKMAVAAVLAASAGPLRSMWQSERKARLAAEARLAAIEDHEPELTDRKQPKAPEGEFAPDADITQVALTRLRRGDFDSRK